LSRRFIISFLLEGEFINVSLGYPRNYSCGEKQKHFLTMAFKK